MLLAPVWRSDVTTDHIRQKEYGLCCAGKGSKLKMKKERAEGRGKRNDGEQKGKGGRGQPQEQHTPLVTLIIGSSCVMLKSSLFSLFIPREIRQSFICNLKPCILKNNLPHLRFT